jgi:hypothetical protein
MTYRMPGTVSEVSATLVASTMRRPVWPSKMRSCSAWRQAREQRQHLGVARHGLVRQVLAQMVGGLADFALAGQKHQDVAARVALPEFVHAIGDGLVQAVVAAFLEWPPALLHRKVRPDT